MYTNFNKFTLYLTNVSKFHSFSFLRTNSDSKSTQPHPNLVSTGKNKIKFAHIRATLTRNDLVSLPGNQFKFFNEIIAKGRNPKLYDTFKAIYNPTLSSDAGYDKSRFVVYDLETIEGKDGLLVPYVLG
jgi:hypothetical protein